MNSARLFVLSALARRGPMHGYQIWREARHDRTELWTDLKRGSLYNALHRMTRESLVEIDHDENGSSERTTYKITRQGKNELVSLRNAALRQTRVQPDVVDLALQYTEDLSVEALAGAIDARRQALAAQLAMLEQERRTAAPFLSGLEPIIFEHTLTRLRAEIAWHQDFLERLPDLTSIS